jgi:N-acetyl-gamma-glutamyl-phosphate reductase
MGAVSAYQVGGTHRHTPEIEQALAGAAGGQPGGAATADAARPSVSFTPMLAPMPRGILATCTARLTGAAAGTPAVRAALADAYAGEPFVHVLPEGNWPATGTTSGSNAVHLQAAADAHAGRAVVVAALDNLGKGAAGQAVQAANLMLGLPEAAGLTAQGVAP